MTRFTTHRTLLLPVLLAALAACQDATAPELPAPQLNGNDTAFLDCDPNSDTCDNTNLDVAGSYAFILESFDVGTLVIGGTNQFGQPIGARFTASTVFRAANLNMVPPNPIQPGDPYLPPNPIREYNDALSIGVGGDGSLLYTAISNMAAARVTARVWIDKKAGTVRAFRPIN